MAGAGQTQPVPARDRPTRDGYHELQTLFQLIDRCDRIGLAVREDGAIERSDGMAEVAPEQDLAVRAARALQRHTGVRLGAESHVIKHIPAGGGLGGGSSDAARCCWRSMRCGSTGLSLAAAGAAGAGAGRGRAGVRAWQHRPGARAAGSG